jgi:hypothetical protein
MYAADPPVNRCWQPTSASPGRGTAFGVHAPVQAKQHASRPIAVKYALPSPVIRATRETPLSKPVKAAILASKLPRLANVG